jgi:hypothetical protein
LIVVPTPELARRVNLPVSNLELLQWRHDAADDL